MTNEQLVRCECGLMYSVARCDCGAWFVVRSRRDRHCAACAGAAAAAGAKKSAKKKPAPATRNDLRCDTCGSTLLQAPNPGEPFRTDEPR